MSTAKEILSDWDTYASERSPWLSDWQKLADNFRPRRVSFYDEMRVGSGGRKSYDGTPMYMRERFASGMAAMVMPRVSKWFFGTPEDVELRKNKAAREWHDAVDEIMWGEMNAPASMFSRAESELFNDMVTFGTAPLLVEENPRGDGVRFKTVFLKNIVCVADDYGELIEFGLRYVLMPRQAQRKWGAENLPPRINEAAEKAPLTRFRFIQWVRPRTSDKSRFAFETQIVSDVGPSVIGEAGFYEMPLIPFRWEPETGEFYGTSPCATALPDATVLGAMNKTILKAGHRAADPPGWYVDDAVNNVLNNYPGGMTSIDMSHFREIGRDPVGVFPTPANLPVTRDMQNDTRNQIAMAFFRDILQLPAEGPRMTATEILQRREQFFSIMGPILAWQEYAAAQVPDRVFNILQRQKMFPPPPRELAGREIKFRVASPVERAWKQLQHSALMASVERMAQVIEAKPVLLEKWDWEKIVDNTATAYDYPESWLRDEEEFAQIVQAQEQAAMAAQMAEAAPKVSGALKDVAEIQG